MNKKFLFLLFLIVVVIVLILKYAKKNEQKPTTPITTPTSTSTPVSTPTPAPSNTSSFALGPGNYDFSLMHDGLTRKYKVYAPANYNKNNSTPVVIYFHGGGGSMEGAYNDGVDKNSDKYGFLLVVPAGTGILPNSLLTWNSGKWGSNQCCGYAANNNIDDVGFVSQMMDEVKTKFNIDEKRVYATGISNGGMMAYRLACESSNKIASVAAVAPPAVPDNCLPSRPISIMHIHGTADPCAPFNGGPGGVCLLRAKAPFVAQSAEQMVDAWIQKNSCTTQPTIVYQKGNATCVSYQHGRNGTEVEFCTIEGGGHTWPSGSQYLSVNRIGPVSYDISFDQIWDFFKKHPME